MLVGCFDQSPPPPPSSLGKPSPPKEIAQSQYPPLAGGADMRMLQSFSAAMPASEGAYLPPSPPPPAENFELEAYDSIEAHVFRTVQQAPLSTFSIDVDTAAYSNVRRMLTQGRFPPEGAVRVEEFINYFDYAYPAPDSPETPFRLTLDAMPATWNPDHRLVRIALNSYEIPWQQRPPSNIVFLVDTSGSMNDEAKLPLAIGALRELVERLDERDRVGIVTYAGSSTIALPSTTANNRETISHALEQLQAGGSTHGSGGIRAAYAMARKHFLKNGNNRVILCTDGDFNVGVTDRSELTNLLEQEAADGIYLTILGFSGNSAYGYNNLQESTLEELSNKGNGNYGFIDSPREARRLFGSHVAGTLLTLAKDVKIQVEFNPALVQGYRLIGYENRQLKDEDFNDDTKDAGEVGSGHRVTALYEVVPVGVPLPARDVDALKYQTPPVPVGNKTEWLTVKLRFQAPEGNQPSRLLTEVLTDESMAPANVPDEDLRFASAVAAWGLWLRGDELAAYDLERDVLAPARSALGKDPRGDRAEFLTLVQRSRELKSADPNPLPTPRRE